ncbi:KGG domain-containing protein [Xanthobacter oligotrophicus]|uniref:KGG domain-containing protein n=1 Tax=Xanthobacter oligotrophicus TaxID=2607286 RepID=A0ABW6ZUU9_9HYPH
MEPTRTKQRRGFAAMSPEKQREIASMGGSSVPAEKRSFATNRALAAEAGRKGGLNVPTENRTFSRNPKLASAAGRAGGAKRKGA